MRLFILNSLPVNFIEINTLNLLCRWESQKNKPVLMCSRFIGWKWNGQPTDRPMDRQTFAEQYITHHLERVHNNWNAEHFLLYITFSQKGLKFKYLLIKFTLQSWEEVYIAYTLQVSLCSIFEYNIFI